MESKQRAKIRKFAIITAAWTPVFLFFVVFVSSSGASVSMGVEVGARFTGTAAVLALFVYRLTARFPWPDRIAPLFYLKHMGVAAVFAVLWTGIAVYLDHPLRPSLAIQIMTGGGLALYQVILGTWVYGVIAAVSYAVHGRENALRSDRIAQEARAEAAEARFVALESRLDPHFLYNALHTVSALVTRDPPAAQDAIERLGDMMRYVLERAPGEDVSLEDEWRFTMEYLEFAKLRLGDRLRIHERLESGVGSARIPALTLQPLVENAVRHGVGRRPEGGAIWVEASRDKQRDVLHLLVRDDGVGATEGDGDTPPENSAGHRGNGLTSLRKRLSLRYGDNAYVEVEVSDTGFTVRLRTPFESIPPS